MRKGIFPRFGTIECFQGMRMRVGKATAGIAGRRRKGVFHLAHGRQEAPRFQFKRDFESAFCGARSLEFSRALNPSIQTFKAWLAENGNRIPLEQESRRASGE